MMLPTYPHSKTYMAACALWAVCKTFGMLLILLLVPLPHLLSGEHFLYAVMPMVFIICATFIASTAMWFPLKCQNCGKRVRFLSKADQISPSYKQREESRSITNCLIDTVWPDELRKKTMHCQRCDQPYKLG
jgi:hypothetical protein